MKRTFTTVILAVATILLLQAQVREEPRFMSLGQMNAHVVEIPSATSKFVEREWRTFMKEYGRVKRVKRADQYIIDDAQVMSIGGASTIDIYSQTQESAGAVVHIVWIEMNGEFVNSDDHPDAHAGTVELLEDFAHHVRMQNLEDEIREQEKALKRLESQMARLLRDNESYHKKIDQAKERIAEAERDIEQNILDQSLKTQEIEAQTKIVEELVQRLTTLRSERGN